MSHTSNGVRQVVAWLQPVRAATLCVLWVTFAVVWALPDFDLTLRGVGWLGLAAAICRTIVWFLPGSPRSWWLGLSLAADAVLLTGLLDITGGPFNPFIVMYVVYVWVAIAAVSPAWGAVVSAVAATAFGWLVIDHLQAGLLEHHRLNDFPTHLFTMWFAGAGVAELVAHYVARARDDLAQRQQQVDDARERAARSERLAALTTMAAGAAHELSTPLSTIAVAARELERNAARLGGRQDPAVDALRGDANLIRSEVARCRVILDGMTGRAGGGEPASLDPLTPEALALQVRERLPEALGKRLDVEIAPDAPAPSPTGSEMVQALTSLLKNAFEASAPDGRVSLRFSRRDAMARIEVRDRGVGMSADARRRAGEPFFTTKIAGQGLGLGLFLVRTFAERSGGTLEFETGDGTTAILEIPAAPAVVTS